MNFDLLNHTILFVIGGSRSYGLHTPSSDVDVKGIAIPPLQYYLGVKDRFEQAEGPENISVYLDLMSQEEKEVISNSKMEGVIFELRKFISLAAECNPNILDVLFCRDEEVRLMDIHGVKLREHRDLFISAKAKHTFSGYATSQLKRIKTHRTWLLKPPSHKPTRDEFNLPEHTLIPADQLGAAWAVVQKKLDSWNYDFEALAEPDRIYILGQIQDHLSEIGVTQEMIWKNAAIASGLGENLIQVLDRERRYSSAMTHYTQYNNWKKNRNPDRAKLEEKYLFDTKHASHLIRLYKMAEEILLTGKVNVWRGNLDREELLGIKSGSLKYEELIEWADAQDAKLNKIYESKQYVVPHKPDIAAIDKLCIELISEKIL